MKNNFLKLFAIATLLGLVLACDDSKPKRSTTPQAGTEPTDNGNQDTNFQRNTDDNGDEEEEKGLNLVCENSSDDSENEEESADEEKKSKATKKDAKKQDNPCLPSDFKWKAKGSRLLASVGKPALWEFKFDIDEEYLGRNWEFFAILDEYEMENTVSGFEGKKFLLEWHPVEGDDDVYKEKLIIVARDMSRCYEYAKSSKSLDDTDCEAFDTLIKNGDDKKIDFIFGVDKLTVTVKDEDFTDGPTDSLKDIYCRGDGVISQNNTGKTTAIVDGIKGIGDALGGIDFSSNNDNNTSIDSANVDNNTSNPNGFGSGLKNALPSLGTLVGGLLGGGKKATKMKTGDCLNNAK